MKKKWTSATVVFLCCLCLSPVWGEGFLSPGGAKEVGLMLEEVEVADKHVLDLDAVDVIQRVKVVSVFPLRCQPEAEVGNKQWNK